MIGSGIGPCAPCILEQRVPIRLLWTSPDIRKTFGDRLVDDILAASPGAVIYGETIELPTSRENAILPFTQIPGSKASLTWLN